MVLTFYYYYFPFSKLTGGGCCLNSGVDNGVKKPESVKVPRYIDTRVNDVYPVRKSSDRFIALRGKDKVKVRVFAIKFI